MPKQTRQIAEKPKPGMFPVEVRSLEFIMHPKMKLGMPGTDAGNLLWNAAAGPGVH